MAVLASCTEGEDPDTPPVPKDPIVEEPVTPDPDGEEGILGLFSKLQGKWIYGERDRSQGREKSNAPNRFFGITKQLAKSNARTMDDFQGFIEFLSDSTYIFNDPKVLQSRWKSGYGKFQLDTANSKIILEGLGEVEVKEINAENLKIELKVTSSSSSYSLEAVKRELVDTSEKTNLISRIWSLTDETAYGKELLEAVKSGVEIYGENDQVVDTIYPEEVLIIFTPSGTLMTAHGLGKTIREFDKINWRWNAARTGLITSFDYTKFEEEDDDLYFADVVVLTEDRLETREIWEDSEGNQVTDEMILTPYRK